MSKKKTVILPQNPNHYYGTSVCVGNLNVGDVIFYLPFNKLPSSEIYKIRVEAFARSNKENFYEIHTDKIIFIASQNTRVMLSSYPEL